MASDHHEHENERVVLWDAFCNECRVQSHWINNHKWVDVEMHPSGQQAVQCGFLDGLGKYAGVFVRHGEGESGSLTDAQMLSKTGSLTWGKRDQADA